jgi:hypothetical protein
MAENPSRAVRGTMGITAEKRQGGLFTEGFFSINRDRRETIEKVVSGNGILVDTDFLPP